MKTYTSKELKTIILVMEFKYTFSQPNYKSIIHKLREKQINILVAIFLISSIFDEIKYLGSNLEKIKINTEIIDLKND